MEKYYKISSIDENRDRLLFVYFNSINLIVSLLYKGKLKGLLDSARQFYYGSWSQLRAQSFTPLNTQNKINYQFCPSNRVPSSLSKFVWSRLTKIQFQNIESILANIPANLPSINIPRDKRTRINFTKLVRSLKTFLLIIIKPIPSSKLNSIKSKHQETIIFVLEWLFKLTINMTEKYHIILRYKLLLFEINFPSPPIPSWRLVNKGRGWHEDRPEGDRRMQNHVCGRVAKVQEAR